MGGMRTDRLTPQMRYLVEVSDSRRVEAVTADLKEIGVHVQRIMPRLGMIDAHGPAAAFQAIRKVPGVNGVREDGYFQLPPFDERIPQ
jgi:hypothetical protein